VVVGAAAENAASGLPSYSATTTRPTAGGADPSITGIMQAVGAAAAATAAPADPMAQSGAGPVAPGVDTADTAELEAVETSDAGSGHGGPRRRRRWVKPTAIVGTCVIVLGGAGTAGYLWTQQQYYVGVDGSGHVAIYQGVDFSLAGIKLSHVYTSESITVAGLPAQQQTRVLASITAHGLSDAQSIVSTLSIIENNCATLTAVPTITIAAPSASPSPTASSPVPDASDKSSGTSSTKAGAGHTTGTSGNATASKSPTVTPSPSASPTTSLSSGITGLHQLSAQCPSNAGANGGSGTS
jgi:protein phosphatase